MDNADFAIKVQQIMEATDAELSRLRRSLDWLTAEKHSAQADAEREKNVADSLRVENAELKRQLAEAQAQAAEHLAFYEDEHRQLAEARKDTERLDWLQEQTVDTIYLDDGRIIDVCGGNIRAALDAAKEKAE